MGATITFDANIIMITKGHLVFLLHFQQVVTRTGALVMSSNLTEGYGNNSVKKKLERGVKCHWLHHGLKEMPPYLVRSL